MEATMIPELINTLGFPTAVCVALFWSNREAAKQYQRIFDDLKASLDNNTRAIIQLTTDRNRG